MSSERCELTELLIDQCGCPTHCGGQTPDEEADEYAGYRDSETPGSWFEANYYGTCSRCQEPFKPGHRIRADGGHGWECCT
jgi:hypothetical protein